MTRKVDGDEAHSPTLAATPATVAPGALAVGTRLGARYQILGFLGQGGMGAVYRTLDEKLDEQVALKLVPPQLLLRDEVRLAQRVTHPNVCRTYDLEER